MSYSIEFGTLIKTKVEINSEYIACDNKKILCKDVTMVNWFIWGTDCLIYVKSKDTKLKINCNVKFESLQKCKDRMNTIADYIARFVVARLYNELTERINKGETVTFWDGFIDKDGIILVDKKIFRNTGKHHFKWNEFIVINNENRIILHPIGDDHLSMSDGDCAFEANNWPVLYELLKAKNVKNVIGVSRLVP